MVKSDGKLVQFDMRKGCKESFGLLQFWCAYAVQRNTSVSNSKHNISHYDHISLKLFDRSYSTILVQLAYLPKKLNTLRNPALSVAIVYDMALTPSET